MVPHVAIWLLIGGVGVEIFLYRGGGPPHERRYGGDHIARPKGQMAIWPPMSPSTMDICSLKSKMNKSSGAVQI